MRIPRNFVRNVEMEHVADPAHFGMCSYSEYGKPPKHMSMPYRVRAKLEIVVDIESDEDQNFIRDLASQGLEFISSNGFHIEKLRFVLNEGFQRLPILIKHPDPEIAKFAWILSKYFSKRDEIMPEKIV